MVSCFKEETHTHTLCNSLAFPTIALFTAWALITAMAQGQCPIGLEILFYNLRTLAGSLALSSACLLIAILHVFYSRSGAVKVNSSNE